MRLTKILFAVIAFALTLPLVSAQAGNLQPVALRCEYREQPLGIDEVQPRLTWRAALAGFDAPRQTRLHFVNA